MRWSSPGNKVRILIDAACTLIDEKAETTETFYLITPCLGEDTYGKGYLTKMPGYEWCGFWGEKDKRTMRYAWASHNDRHAYSDSSFGLDNLEIRYIEKTRSLEDSGAVYHATMESPEPIVCRTTIRDDVRHLTAIMEYPCNTMNVVDNPMRFQVDTGPIAIPDFTISAARNVEMFEVAYVLFNRFDEAEFVIRKPVPVGGWDRPLFYRTDYSELRSYAAKNAVLIAA